MWVCKGEYLIQDGKPVKQLWQIGFYDPVGNWQAVWTTHLVKQAAATVHYLNGGSLTPAVINFGD